MSLDHITIILSAAAFLVSVYTLWTVRVSPFQLTVYPPAVSLFNSAESSLVLDMTFFNRGRTPAAVLDMEITLSDEKGNVVLRSLKPQAFHQSVFPYGDFANRHWVISRFSAFAVKRQESVNKTIYFAQGVSKRAPHKKVQQETTRIEAIRIAFNVNGRWNKKYFTVPFSEFEEYQQQREASLVKPPFAPRFFPDVKPLCLRGSIFDPVF